jgi:hypothetical protein
MWQCGCRGKNIKRQAPDSIRRLKILRGGHVAPLPPGLPLDEVYMAYNFQHAYKLHNTYSYHSIHTVSAKRSGLMKSMKFGNLKSRLQTKYYRPFGVTMGSQCYTIAPCI